jgi:hypothetical protein
MRKVLAVALLALVACGGSKPMAVHAEVSTGSDAKESDGPAQAAPAAAASDPAPAPREVSVQVAPLAPGAAWTEQMTVGFNFVAAVDRAGTPVTVDTIGGTQDEVRVEVLETDGKSVGKLKVGVTKEEGHVYANGQVRRLRGGLVGKAYVLARRADGVLVITTDRGAKVAAREGDMLSRRFGEVLRAPILAAGIPDKPMRVGEPVDGLSHALRAQLVAALDGATLRDAQVSLQGTRDVAGVRCAVFLVKVDMTMHFHELKVRQRLEGELLLRADNGGAVSMALAGLVALEGERGAGEGTTRVTVRWTS